MSNNIKDLIEAARTYVAEANDDRIRAESQDNKPTELSFFKFNLAYWRRLWLKRNQPKNYFRVTKITAPLEGGGAYDIYKFQVWIRGTLAYDYRATQEAYEYFATQPDWKAQSDEPTFFIFRPQGSL